MTGLTVLRTLGVAVVISAAGASPASARLPSAAGTQRLADAVVASGVPGVSVAVGDGARVRLVSAGLAQRGRRAPLRPSARFRVGSVTKPMTAALILRLAEDGRLGLDDPVVRWVPEIGSAYATVAVRQLLDHTSGLGEYYDPAIILKPYLDGDSSYVWDPLTLIRLGIADTKPGRPPRPFAYSDTNYVIAGLIAERAGGQPLAGLFRRLVFDPLGMSATSYATLTGTPRRIAHGYTDIGGGTLEDTTTLSPSIAQGAGAVVSDAADLLRFERGLLGGRLLRPSSLRAMRSTVSMADAGFPAQDGYGLGLWRTRRFGVLPRSVGCGALWGHNGETVGYTADAFASSHGRHRFAVLLTRDALTQRQTLALARLLAGVAC